LKLSRFPRRIRFGWETEPTGPGSETIVVSKIDTYGAVPNRTYRVWEGKIGRKNRKLNAPGTTLVYS